MSILSSPPLEGLGEVFVSRSVSPSLRGSGESYVHKKSPSINGIDRFLYMFAFYHDYSLELSLTRTGYELPRWESFPCTYGSLVYFNFPSENVGIIPLCFRK